MEEKLNEAAVTAEAERQEVENTTSAMKCPSCGANMVFSAEKGALYCEYCGCVREVAAESSEEIDFSRLLSADSGWANESHVFFCRNCGAREVLAKNEIATTCSFCGTPNIVETDELPGLRPNAVVPFAVSKEQASSFARKWMRKRVFAPRKFRKGAKPEEIRGMYMPAFTFDAVTDSVYSARLGVYRYRTVRRNGRTVQERYTKYFNVSGRFDFTFDDILVQASSEKRRDDMKKIQPFDTRRSRAYTQAYLSGFTAEQSDVPGTQCWEEAKDIMRGRLRAQILSGYRYDVVASFDISTRYSDVTYKYILLPVYVGHSTWRSKLYNFFVNGASGKVAGKAPVSPLKVCGVVLLGAAVVALLAWLWLTFMGG